MLITQYVDSLVRDAIVAVGGPFKSDLEALRRELQPPTVAIVGQVSSGKSTLVNALLGTRAAATGDTETTRVLARFYESRDHRDLAEAVLRDGERHRVAFEDRRALPRELDWPPEQVALLDVSLNVDNGILARMSLIDTPGLGSLSGLGAVTAELLTRGDRDDGQPSPPLHVDALVVVINDDLHRDELRTVREFQLASQSSISAAQTIGVLSRADLIEHENPWQEATSVANDIRARAGGAFLDVLPLMGLIAETGETGALSSELVDQLELLADCEPDALRHALRDVALFRAASLPVAAEAREQLLGRLQLPGIELAASLLRTDPGLRSAAALRRRLRDLSGVHDVRRSLDRIGWHADATKARAAIERLRDLVESPAAGATERGLAMLSRLLGEMEREQAIHRISVIEAWSEVAAGVTTIPPELVQELERMACGETPEERMGVEPEATLDDLRAAILDGHRRWEVFANQGAGSITQSTRERIGRTMTVAFTFEFQALEDRTVGQPASVGVPS